MLYLHRQTILMKFSASFLLGSPHCHHSHHCMDGCSSFSCSTLKSSTQALPCIKKWICCGNFPGSLCWSIISFGVNEINISVEIGHS